MKRCLGVLALFGLVIGVFAEAYAAPSAMRGAAPIAAIANGTQPNLPQPISGGQDTLNHRQATAFQPVDQGIPVITWATPAPVGFGTALGDAQLNATANVPGTFSYSPAAGTVMSTAGQILLSVVFTPSDTADYKTASAKVYLVVYKGNPVITWAKPAAVSFGTALGAAQLNATANVPGTFSYSPSAGTVMDTAGFIALSVVFTPSDTADYKTASAKVTLGVYKGTPVISWPTPAAVSFGTALGAAQLNATANVPGTFSYSPAAGTLMSTAGSIALSVVFTPNDTADYKTASAKVYLLVYKGNPVITWAKPAAVSFGTALGAAQLNATANVPGTFSYSPAAGTVMSTAGSIALSVVFTPSDTANYRTTSGKVFLLVHKALPVITWTTPAPVVIGAALSAAQLNATATVPGTFSYWPAAGTVMSSAGTTTLAVVFTPDDTANCHIVSATTFLTVTEPDPAILWAKPTPVARGTALGAAQLNATASVPGTFSYTPAAGTVMSQLGTATLSAVFTPTDTAKYKTVMATVPLNVFASKLRANIQHIIIVMQENRSFDNLFSGYPGADSAQSGKKSDGSVIQLAPVPLEQGTDVVHAHLDWVTDWDNGKMDGFSHADTVYPIPDMPYAYVPRDETAPLWDIASAFTLGDRMFQSNSGPSFPAHQYLIAGQSGHADENPIKDPSWGCDSLDVTTVAMIGPNGTDLPGGFPCLDYQTMGDVLDAKGISWTYYAPTVANIWSAYDAIYHIRYGPDWNRNIVTPSAQVLQDIQNGKLAQVTWIVPDASYSDHAAPVDTSMGPSWVANIVNAVGGSQYWDSTVILISWDDWGGWYDHVSPPQIDEMGLGFRVPLLVVSPWAKRGYISHHQHEFGSFLKFTEEVFDLPSLGTRDAISDDLSDCFDFNQSPPPFVPISAPEGPGYFTSAKPSGVPPDDD